MSTSASFGTILITSRSRKSSFDGSKSLPGDQPDPRHARDHRRVLRGRRVGLHQLREALEVGDGVHRVDLLAHRGLHVELGIDDAGRRRVRLAVRGERHDRELVLQRVHRLVILRRAVAVDAPEDPHHAGGRLDLLHARRKRARPARPGDRIGLRLAARRARARDLEHLRPAVQHRHDVVALAHVGDAEDPRLLRHVEPDLGVQRVGVGRGAAVVVHRRVAAHLDHLPHRGMLGIRLRDVGLLLADRVEGDQRVAVDVGLDGDADRLHRAQRRRLVGGCETRQCGQGPEAQGGGGALNRLHRCLHCARRECLRRRASGAVPGGFRPRRAD